MQNWNPQLTVDKLSIQVTNTGGLYIAHVHVATTVQVTDVENTMLLAARCSLTSLSQSAYYRKGF